MVGETKSTQLTSGRCKGIRLGALGRTFGREHNYLFLRGVSKVREGSNLVLNRIVIREACADRSRTLAVLAIRRAVAHARRFFNAWLSALPC